ncbi:MAG: response regulator [Candidatus Omnitrophica bacterium]|nr:response regulator [Candidatus Omnitrophota bacterium]
MPHTILIVEDEPVSRALAQKKVAEFGYEVLTAANGEEALKVLEKTKPDLILLDVEMPVMNGYTFIGELAKKNYEPKIPVLVLTAHEEMGPIFKRHGVRGYLIKPLNIEQVKAKIQEVLDPNPS